MNYISDKVIEVWGTDVWQWLWLCGWQFHRRCCPQYKRTVLLYFSVRCTLSASRLPQTDDRLSMAVSPTMMPTFLSCLGIQS